MRVLLFLLLAVSTAAVHHVEPSATPDAAAVNEARAVYWESRAAQAETWTALGTGFLAVATILTLIVTSLQRRGDIDRRETERQIDDARQRQHQLERERADSEAAFRTMFNILLMYQRRLDPVFQSPEGSSAEKQLRGLDVTMQRAMSDSMVHALPPAVFKEVMESIFKAHQALATVAYLQSQNNPGRHHDSIQGMIQDATHAVGHANAILAEKARDTGIQLGA